MAVGLRSGCLPLHGLQHVAATEEGLQGLWYPYRAVGLLVVLQDRDDPAGGGQGAVERGERLRLAAGIAVADVQPAGLERRAVRGGGDLAVALLAGDPRLAVELAGGAGAQIAGRHVDHPVRHLHLGEHLLLPGEPASRRKHDDHPTYRRGWSRVRISPAW